MRHGAPASTEDSMEPEIKEAIKACAAARVELTAFFRNSRANPNMKPWTDLAHLAREYVMAAETLLWNGIDPTIEDEPEKPEE